MKHLLLPFIAAALAVPLAAQTIDVDQPSNTTCMAGFNQADLAQSFKPNASDCSGAGLFMTVGWGGAEDVTISLYDALPNAGGTQLATGTVLGNPGTYVDVFWPAVPVTPGNTYYIVFTSNLQSMCVAGDTNDPYPDGQVYANAGYGSFPTFDYTFRTWTGSGSGLSLQVGGVCPNLTLDITGGTPLGRLALASSTSLGSFSIPGGHACAGTSLALANPFLNAVLSLDSAGAVSYPVVIPAGACGRVFVQVVDLSSCATSSAIGL